jgi:hypothetical protein
MKKALVVSLLVSITVLLCAQDDRSILFRKEVLWMPSISTNGYGISFVSAKRRTLNSYLYLKISFNEIKHRKEIKGVNPKYPNENQFIYGKVNHAYPFGFYVGFQKKLIIKENSRAIGLRYYYGIGAEMAFLKPAFYQIELVYSQDSSVIITDQFDPEFHNVNNIKERAPWFKGVDMLKIAPGGSLEAGVIVDFSRRPGRIHGVGISANIRTFILPVEVLAGEPNRRIYFGFSLSYVWGKYFDYQTPENANNKHSGWGMLKKS